RFLLLMVDPDTARRRVHIDSLFPFGASALQGARRLARILSHQGHGGPGAFEHSVAFPSSWRFKSRLGIFFFLLTGQHLVSLCRLPDVSHTGRGRSAMTTSAKPAVRPAPRPPSPRARAFQVSHTPSTWRRRARVSCVTSA